MLTLPDVSSDGSKSIKVDGDASPEKICVTFADSEAIADAEERGNRGCSLDRGVDNGERTSRNDGDGDDLGQDVDSDEEPEGIGDIVVVFRLGDSNNDDVGVDIEVDVDLKLNVEVNADVAGGDSPDELRV